jgi:tripartite-type tricarboxylate transporter receptor subunit TctC
MQEAGIAGFEADAWFGLFAPAGTPASIVDRLNGEVNRALQSPAIRQKFETLGCEPAGGTAAAFGAYFRDEIEKWRKVIEAAGLNKE